MKLLLYELLKLYKKKVIITLIPLLLLVNCWIYVQQELKDHHEIIEHGELYTEFEAQFRVLPVEQAHKEALETRDKLSGFQLYLFIERNKHSDTAQIFENNENFQRYGLLYPNSEYVQNEPLLLIHLSFISTIVEQLEALQAYPAYVEKIEIQADNMLLYSIFNNPNSFSIRNIVKTPKDFEQVKDVPLQLGLDYGVVSGTTFRMTDMLLLSILIILSIFIFQTEREQGQIQLLNTMKYGRIHLFISKLLLLIVLSFVTALLFYGSIMLLANRLYGFGDGARYIQSIGAFKFANLRLTVHEYLTWYLVGKVVICGILALLFTFIFLLFKHLSKSLVALALILSTSYMAYRFIEESSYLNLMKYMNIMALLDTSQLITNYVNLNLFGYPITWLRVSFITFWLLAVVLITGCSFGYAKSSLKSNESSALRWRTTIQLILKWLDPLYNSTAIVWHESIKQLWTAKGLFILLVALLISVQDIHHAKVVMDNNQYYYNEYMEQLSGPLTDEKIEFLEHERDRRNNIGNEFQQITMQYQAGAISFQQYLAAQEEIEQLQLSAQAFDKIYFNYQYLLERKQNRDANVYFVNEYTTNYLFNNTNRDQMNVMIFGLLVTIYLSSVYTVDSHHHMLLKTTKRGRLQLFATVWLHGLGVATIILIIIYIPQYINAVRLYPAMEWQAPIQSLQQFGNMVVPITLQQLVVFVSLCQCIGVAAISIVFLLLAQLLKRFTLTLLSGILLVLCPTAIAWLGFHTVMKYTLHYPQLMYSMLGSQRIGEVVTYFLGLAVFILVCLWSTWRYYTNGSVWGRISLCNTNMKKYKEKEVKLS